MIDIYRGNKQQEKQAKGRNVRGKKNMKSFELEQEEEVEDEHDDEFEDEMEGLLQIPSTTTSRRPTKARSTSTGRNKTDENQNNDHYYYRNAMIKVLIYSLLIVGSIVLLRNTNSSSTTSPSPVVFQDDDNGHNHEVIKSNQHGDVTTEVEGGVQKGDVVNQDQVHNHQQPSNEKKGTHDDDNEDGDSSDHDNEENSYHSVETPFSSSPTISPSTRVMTEAPSSMSSSTVASSTKPNTITATNETAAAATTTTTTNTTLLPSSSMTTNASNTETFSSDSNHTTSSSESRTYTYKRRGRILSTEEKEKLTTKYGSWNLIDSKYDIRPKDDYYKQYINRDVPRTEFPETAWQLDTDYVSKFLNEGLQLLNRTMIAILHEYGYEDVGATTMFDTILYDDNVSKLSNVTFLKLSQYTQNGWTTQKSYDNLKRRILHSIMTQDTFIFVMGGHSAAAGHGNHFQQSYTLQVSYILQPIFARLGVKHVSRNFGMGGLGTFHNSISSKYLYGPDVDFLLWDSGMTEGDPDKLEMFARQAIMTPNDENEDGDSIKHHYTTHQKVPAIWNLPPSISTLLHDMADVDVGQIGTGYDGIKEAQSVEDLDTIPWAAKYIRCSNDIKKEYCQPYKYNGTCWIDRKNIDGFVPPTKQDDVPGGRAGWHPGNREHQLTGRLITWLLLSCIRDALLEWQNAENYILPDTAWHVTSMYDNTRTKLAKLHPSKSNCQGFIDLNMTYLCTVPMKARSEFTPRAYPHLTNIRSIMPKEMLANLPPPEEPIYNPPDIFNPYLHPPPGEVDVLSIVENGLEFLPVLDPSHAEEFYQSTSTITELYHTPGKGIYPSVYVGSDYCDGTLDSWCDRGADNTCMLRAHNDGRTGLLFDGLSGWLIVNIPKVKHGHILAKIEPWHAKDSNPLTEGWKTINNEPELPGRTDEENDSSGGRRLVEERRAEILNHTHVHAPAQSRRRGLKDKKVDYCKDFRFEYAIDDQEVKSLSISEYNKIQYRTQRVVDIVTLLNEPETWGEERDVQLAMRMTGCGRDKVFSLNHVYWS